MSPSITTIEEIDLEISVAYITLGAARQAFSHCPSGENASAVADAEEAVDRLLDERLAVRR